MPSPQNPPPEPYVVITNNGFADAAAGSFEIRKTIGGFILVGPCPRCGDPMEFPWVDDSYRRTKTVITLPETRRVIPMLCTCTGSHDGRPADGIGCGAYWALEVEDSE
jgi:hypothetical protein